MQPSNGKVLEALLINISQPKQDNWRYLKVAQNSFQHFPRCRFWLVIITTLYQLMPQSWYHRTAQSLVNTLALFWGSPLGLAGCGIWLFSAVIFEIWVEKRGGKREFQLLVGAGFCVFIGLGCEICKGNRVGYGISITLTSS